MGHLLNTDPEVVAVPEASHNTVGWIEAGTLARELIHRHEGYSQFPKADAGGTVQIGYGTNLTRRGLSKLEAGLLVARDVADIERALERFEWWSPLTPARQAVLIDMAYQLGIRGLLEFKHMIDFISHGQFQLAADAMLSSKAALETPARFKANAEVMRSGVLPDES